MIGKRLAKMGTVVAIEPNPSTFAALQRNVAVNELNNVLCLQVACWDEEGFLTLFSRRLGSSGNSLVHRYGPGPAVQVCPLDTLVERYGIRDVRLIKIDVEGAEARVLRGAQKTIARDSPRLIVEVWPPNYGEVTRLLQQWGYHIQWADRHVLKGWVGGYLVAERR
ncbi:hypothetical protein HRbin23_00066 [bacterium HR23]|nr:hypothetical protein HRbin23_00066 [bacterium HR23]